MWKRLMPVEIEFDPDVFHGELTANRGQVFVRAERTADLQDCKLYGYVHGPRCEFAHTLLARYSLVDLGPGSTLLGRATITDPCLWTSDLPQIYDVHVELRRGIEVLARAQRMIGLRGIGPRTSPSGGQLVRESKVWVPRGVAIDSLAGDSLVAQLREELLVGVCSAPSAALLDEASRRGAYLIVQVNAAEQDLPATLRALSRWPAVMLAVIQGGEALARGLQQVAPNLILAQAVRAEALPALTTAAWANVLVVELGVDQKLESIPAMQLPLLVQRDLPQENLSAAAARGECDRLQRDLATVGQFAGYMV